jgi:hypothetical protein
MATAVSSKMASHERFMGRWSQRYRRLRMTLVSGEVTARGGSETPPNELSNNH